MRVDLLVVGSGPVGATFARVVSERLPTARIMIVDAGPVLTDPPGLNLKNLEDESALQRARELSQGPPDAARGNAGIPAVEGTVTARQGTHLVDTAGGMPAACIPRASAAWRAPHCATPRPYASERIPFIPPAELDGVLALAERLLATTTLAFAESPQGAAIRKRLGEVFDSELPEGRKVGILPVAGRATGTAASPGPASTRSSAGCSRRAGSSSAPRRSAASYSCAAGASREHRRAPAFRPSPRSRRPPSSSPRTPSERRSCSGRRASARPPSGAT